MSRELCLPIFVFSLLIMLPVSATSLRFAFCEESLDRYSIDSESSDSYISVPFHYQNNNYYCGPAALEMVFDCYGEDIPQAEIADVARTYPFVTFTDELRRAAHFSNLSTSRGDEIPGLNITGYSARKFGYGAFEQGGLTIDNLKLLIDRKEPVIVLMWWTPAKNYGHYRVVTGYNETHITMHDPWNKDAWGGVYGGANTSMSYPTFLDLWEYTGNWSLLVRPWDVELQIPETIVRGEDFEVIANITYTCSTPFDTGQYPTSSSNATIQLPEGLKLASGETTQHSLGNVNPGSSVHTAWALNANETGSYNISLIVKGKVEGSVGPHGNYSSYNYEDVIGGSCTAPVSITNQTHRVHNLDTGLNYTTIQEAIDANETKDGHTIFVENETYYENVVVDKALWLIGENNCATIIDGKGIDNVLTITAENVNITGFSIQNSGSTWQNNFGVDFSSRRHCTIENCVIKNHHYSVYLAYAHDNTVRNNIITNSSSYSIYISSGDNNTIIGNTITGNENTGVEIEEGSEGNIIANNSISSNKYEGVYVLHSDSNLVINNLLSFNGHGNPPLIYPGIKLMYSNNNTLAKNIILNNTGGIIIYFDWGSISARYNTIEDNVIENNDYGIILHYGGNQSHPSTATYNQVYENTLKNNGYGFYLIGADNNTFYHNNLLESTTAQVVVENSTNIWDNGLEGNYWSNYTGVDSDHDGIGDTPHFLKGNNSDNYPLMGMFSSFNTPLGKHVNIISNSTLENFEYFESNSTIKLYVSGEEGFGFCRVSIPHVLMNVSNISVVIDDELTPVLYPNYTLYDNGTHRWIYFAYTHSVHEIDIIPEFPSFLVLPLLMIATLLAVVVLRDQKSFHKSQELKQKSVLIT